jgi:SAM-dependent methyltransferase
MHLPVTNLRLSRYEYAEAVIADLADTFSGKVLFDIGCGDGPMKRVVRHDLEWFGFDLFPQNKDVERWDLSEPYNGCRPKADAALMLDVLEHCLNPGAALENVASVLKPGGYLILTTPNPRWSKARLSFATTGVFPCFTDEDLSRNHHVFTPWPHIVEKMLHDVGFEPICYVTLDGWTRPFDRKLSLTYPFRVASALLGSMIEAIDPSACGMSQGFLCRRGVSSAEFVS